MAPGDAVHITPGTVHRMTAISDCDIFEVSTPELHDVVRLEDRYGRTPEAARGRHAAFRNTSDRRCLRRNCSVVGVGDWN